MLGGPTPIFLLNLELDGRSCMDVVGGWVGACFPHLSPSFHSLFGHVERFILPFLATYAHLDVPKQDLFPFDQRVPSSPNISDKAIIR